MPAAKSSLSGAPVKTDIPARLDRLPWSRFHLLIVVGLGVEVTIAGALFRIVLIYYSPRAQSWWNAW